MNSVNTEIADTLLVGFVTTLIILSSCGIWFIISIMSGERLYNQQMVIDSGHAEWVMDHKGGVKFEWITISNQLENVKSK